MLKLDILLFEQTPQLGLVRTWDGVCLHNVGCTRYFVELAPFHVFFVQTKPTWTYFEKNVYLELIS